MELRELYENIGGDYDEVMMRFMKEERVNRFIPMFLKDGSFAELQKAVAEQDWNTAFRAAHTLKGVAGNMSFERLRAVDSDLTEAIRGGVPLQDITLYEKVCAEYEAEVALIQAYLAERA